MSVEKADMHEAVNNYLATENPEETADSLLTAWAVVGWYESLDQDSDSAGYFAVSGSGSPVTSVGLLRMGERYLLDD